MNSQSAHFEIVIMGHGIGGQIIANSLAPSGKRILILGHGPEFTPTLHTPLRRLTKEDFSLLRYQDGISPEWPVSAQELEPYYRKAETFFALKENSSDSSLELVFKQLESENLHPFYAPIYSGKSTHEEYVRLASKYSNVTFLNDIQIERLETDELGRSLKKIRTKTGNEFRIFTGNVFVLAAGAVDSAVLLLKSEDANNPNGLSNSSGLVGKNLMYGNHAVILSSSPVSTDVMSLKKTICVDDYYLGSRTAPLEFGRNPVPVGSIQFEGGSQTATAWHLVTEDLPLLENRVEIDEKGKLRIVYQSTNTGPHSEFIRQFKKMLNGAGFNAFTAKPVTGDKVVFARGTLVFGKSPQKSVLDIWGCSHDHRNLYAADGGFFPSCTAVNPVLTVAAQAFRTVEHILKNATLLSV